jgi:TonB family protein
MLAEIANHLWQSTLFAAAIGVLTLLLRNDGAHVRYWLWWAASLKFLVPFSLLTMLGEAVARNADRQYALSDWAAAVGWFAEPLETRDAWPTLVLVSLGVWAVGWVAVVGRWLISARKVTAVLRSAAPHPGFPFVAGACPPVKHTNAFVEPSIVGLLRQTLLLPEGIAARLTPAQLEAVIAHELCHWRRRDNLTAAVHMLVEALFWFHPLVWWIGARLVQERERACDEAVVAAGHDRRAYSEGILRVCESYLASPLRCVAGVGGADLKNRIRQIMRYRPMKLRVAKRLALSAAGAIALLVPLAAGLVNGTTASAQDRPPIIPLVRIAPNYPEAALAAGLEGSVSLEFTIAKNGTTKDAVVLESTSPLFDEAALRAFARWRYVPQAVDGNPVEISGQQTVIRFQLCREADGCISVNPPPPPPRP